MTNTLDRDKLAEAIAAMESRFDCPALWSDDWKHTLDAAKAQLALLDAHIDQDIRTLRGAIGVFEVIGLTEQGKTVAAHAYLAISNISAALQQKAPDLGKVRGCIERIYEDAHRILAESKAPKTRASLIIHECTEALAEIDTAKPGEGGV